jgi:hypothetical protein
MTAYLWAAAAVLAGIVAPGLAIAALCDRRAPAVTPERFTTIALAGGLSFWVLAARVLDRLGGLTRGGSITMLATVAVASVVVLVGPGRATLRAVASRDSARFSGWAFGSTLLGAAPLLKIVLDQRDALLGSTPWYYWSLIRQTITAGGTPGSAWEWGRRLPFLDDYPGFTPAVALLALPASSASLAAAHVAAAVAMLGAGLAVFLLVRALHGSRLGAALAVLLFFAADVFATKLVAIRPESAGYAFAILAPVLALEYFRTRERRVLALLAATFTALGLVHGIDWLFGGALLAAAIVTAIPGRAGLRRWLTAAVAVVVVTVAAWALAGVVLGGSLSGASSLGELPVKEAGEVDPTWQFAALVQGSPDPDPPSTGHLVSTSLDRGLRALGAPWFVALAALMVAGLIGRALVSGPQDRDIARRALVFLGVAALVTLVIALGFAVGWSTYVPRRTGFARVFQVALLLVPIGVGVVVSRFVDTTAQVATRAIAVAVTAGAVFVAFVYVHGRDRLDEIADQRPRRETLAALRDLDLPDDAVVLTNGYSEGLLAVVTGATGVLDGRAPYTDAPLLTRANTLLVQAKGVIDGSGAYLPCTGITHVLVATDGGRTLGMPAAFATDLAALDDRADLRLAGEGPNYRLYRVRDPDRPVAPNDPLECTSRS